MKTVLSKSRLAPFLKAAAATSDGDVLARAAADGPLGAYGALRVAIYVADEDGTTLRMTGHSGGDEVRRLYSTLPVDDATPNAVAFRTGVEIFIEIGDVSDEYPLLSAAAALYADNDDVQFAVIPVSHAGARVGVMGILFDHPLPMTWQAREDLDAVAAVVGLWCEAHRAQARSAGAAKALTLTARQRSILRLARDGMTNAQIAIQLGFAESTVKADLTALYRLTGATSRPDLLNRTSDLT